MREYSLRFVESWFDFRLAGFLAVWGSAGGKLGRMLSGEPFLEVRLLAVKGALSCGHSYW